MAYSFPTVSRFKKGYATAEVDDFFARARHAYEGGIPAEKFSYGQVKSAVFNTEAGGYDTAAVDSAIQRMANAFLERDRDNHIAVNGTRAWMDTVARRATTLYPRMLRPHGERFAHPTSGPGYNAAAVDALVDRIADYFDRGEPLTSSDVSQATFKAASGTNAYAEGVVDAYLARVVEILQSVE